MASLKERRPVTSRSFLTTPLERRRVTLVGQAIWPRTRQSPNHDLGGRGWLLSMTSTALPRPPACSATRSRRSAIWIGNRTARTGDAIAFMRRNRRC
jgi:hypothetical protein